MVIWTYSQKGIKEIYGDRIKQLWNIKHYITLKIGQSCSDDMTISLEAHEYRHYLQWKKYGVLTMARRINGRIKRPIQAERDANKWAKQRVEKIGYKYCL